MPAGKYRMVASVRGPKNMRIHAAINDIAETSLILSGWNFAEVGNVPIINTNGVQMPPTSIESAYNQGAYCQGWHWLAVEGTLEHAGELLLTFSSNAGEAQISNVYLYYLDGGNVISLVENEHLANRDKTVTADICVSSPNAITSSDTPITTAAGETMVNNVANGEIEQLVLYESHAFTPIDATAVNAKLYKKFSKSMWNVVTLPFIPEHKFTYYSPFHIEDNTIYISETTPESNTPYIMKSDSVRTYITGKNVVLKAEMNTVNMGDALLEGNYDLLTFEQNDNYYTWGTNRFAIVSETVSINPFAAWLQLSTPTNVKSYKLEVADPTAIEQVQVSTDSDNTPTYDLTGRIVPDNMKQKGIYLKKGNKYYINK